MLTNRVSSSQAARLRGTDQQVGNLLLAKAPTIRRTPGSLVSPISSHGMEIKNFKLQNRSGSADMLVGIGYRLPNHLWDFYTEDDGVFTKDNDCQATLLGAAPANGSVALGTNGDDGGGFTILSRVKFNWLSVNVTTQSTANEKTAVVQYSNAAGTGWTTVGAGVAFADDFTVTAGTWSTGENIYVFPDIPGWGKITSLESLPDGYYGLSIAATTEATAAGLAGGIEIGTLAAMEENVDDGISYKEEICSYYEPHADALVAFFSIAAAGNYVSAEWVHRG